MSHEYLLGRAWSSSCSLRGKQASWESFCILILPNSDWFLYKKNIRRRVVSRRLRVVEVRFLFCFLRVFFYKLFNFIFSISRSWPRRKKESNCVRKLDARQQKKSNKNMMLRTSYNIFIYTETFLVAWQFFFPSFLYFGIFNYIMIHRDGRWDNTSAYGVS